MDPRELREATRAEHEATENLMPLMVPALKPATYIRVLQVLFPLLESWEIWAEGAATEELRAMLQKRTRSHLLLADLEVFGARPVQAGNFAVDWKAVVMGGADEGPLMHTGNFEASLLGAVYVMEGSTLGGRFLARHLEQVLGLQPGVGDAYFHGHREATGKMWHEVLEQITAIPTQYAPLTISAARRTFEVFDEALRAGLPAAQVVQH